MQIVIDIPEDYYNVIKAIHDRQCDADMLIIKSGTPLPKGHGRLIDADAFLKDNDDYTGWILCPDAWGGENGYLEDLVADAPTIVEADKEVE